MALVPVGSGAVAAEGMGPVGVPVYAGVEALYNAGKFFRKYGKNMGRVYLTGEEKEKALASFRKKRARKSKPKSNNRTSAPKKSAKLIIKNVKTQHGGLGTRMAVTSKRKGHKTKRSLKKRIRALEKKNGNRSMYKFRNVRPVTLSTEGLIRATTVSGFNQNPKAIYEVAYHYSSPSSIEGKLNTIKTDDGTTNYNFGDATRNPSLPLHHFHKFEIKNSGLASVTLKYAHFKTKMNGGNRATIELNNVMGDRGYATWSSNGGITVGVATNSHIPPHIAQTNEHARVEIMSYLNKTQQYKLSTIHTISLNPGEKVDLIQRSDYVYKAEDSDRDSETYYKDHYFGFLIQVEGEIMHDATAHEIVGYSDVGLDCIQTCVMSVGVDNGLGEDRVDHDCADIQAAANGFVAAGPNHIVAGDEN